MENNIIENEVIIEDESIKKHKFGKPFWAGLTYLIIVVLFVVFKLCLQLGFLSNTNETFKNIISSGIIQVVLMFSLPMFLYSLFNKQKLEQTIKDFRFKKISKKAIGFSFLIGISCFFLVGFVATFFNNILYFFGVETAGTEVSETGDYTVASLLITIMLSAILPAICEETAHRGMLLGANSKYGATFAIIVSSLCFGFLHMNIFQCFYAILFGFLLGYIAIYTKSIISCIIMHFTNNALNILSEYCYHNNWLGGGYYGWQTSFLEFAGAYNYYVIAMFVFLASILLLIYGVKRLIQIERFDNEIKNMPLDEQEKLIKIQEQAKVFNVITPYQNINNIKYKFFVSYSMQKARKNGEYLLNYLENPNGKKEYKWYDNIFLWTALVTSIFYSILSFISFVL